MPLKTQDWYSTLFRQSSLALYSIRSLDHTLDQHGFKDTVHESDVLYRYFLATMRLRTLALAYCVLVPLTVNAFQPASKTLNLPTSRILETIKQHQPQPLQSSADDNAATFLRQEALITPAGKGFLTPVKQVLGKASYCKVQDSDPVVSVMDKLSSSSNTAALVFNSDDKLVGLFTEEDYMRVSTVYNRKAEDEVNGCYSRIF